MTKDATILLTEATKAQLREFATVTLGLEVGNLAKRTEILAKIREAWDEDTITVNGADETPEPKPTAENPLGLQKSALKAAKETTHVQDNEHDPQDPNHPANRMETIFIDIVDEAGGADPVWLSVNGKGIWVTRGKDVRIKHKYVHDLENAVRTVYEQELDEQGIPSGPMIPRQVKAYPWRRVVAIDQAVA